MLYKNAGGETNTGQGEATYCMCLKTLVSVIFFIQNE